MGNYLYRPTPRRTHNTEEGHYTFYDYGVSQITGWRHKQEDRYVCLPNFFEDWSLFAVYDGHGGQQVVQYLQRYLHQHIINELELHNDPELALYLGFLTCDNSLRNITGKEYSVIQDDLELEFEVADQEERREVIFGFKGLLSKDVADVKEDSSGSTNNDDDSAGGASKKSAGSTLTNEDTTHAPGTSKGSSNRISDELKAEITSACLNELPSIIFLTKAPFEREDESDEDYEPEKDNIKHDIFETSAKNGGRGSSESEESEDEDEDSAGNEGEESALNEGEAPAVNEGEASAVNEREESAGNEGGESAKNEDQESDKMEVEESCVKEGDEFAEKKDAEQSGNHSGGDKKNNNAEVGMPSEAQKKEETTKEQNEADIYADFGAMCGSTATVLLLNEKKLFLAHVGDSRCVACVNGQAVDLSVDHKPTIKEENIRITDAGGTVSEDERVNDYLDMSRAFGDFGLKEKNVAEPFQILSCEPDITTIEITDGLEFVIVASDGIWNTMDSAEVIDYLKNRMQDTEMELHDICGELFEEMLPSEATSDGSGCDNMTAILIRFKKLDKARSITDTVIQECYKYYYPPEHRKKYVRPEANTSAGQDEMLPAHECEESKSQLKQIASCPSTSAGQDEMLLAHECEESKSQSKQVASCPSTSAGQDEVLPHECEESKSQSKQVASCPSTSAGQEEMLPAHECEESKSQSKQVASCPSTSAGQDEVLPHECEESKSQSKQVASCPSTSARQDEMLPAHECEESKSQSKQVASCPSTSTGQDEMLPAHECDESKSQSKQVASCPSTSAGQDEMLPAHDCEELESMSKEVASCPSTSEDHCVSLDPGDSTSDIEMENTVEPIPLSAPPSIAIANQCNCRKHCQDLWSYISILKNKLDALNQDMLQAKRDVEDAILRCENCKCHSYVASSSNIFQNAASSSSIHPHTAYSSNIHQNTTSGSSIHPNVASVPNIPMVNFDALHFKRRFKSQQEAAGSSSMTEQKEGESGSKTRRRVAANAFEVIDLCSEEDSSETVNRIASENEGDEEDENELNYAQAMKRAAEDADEVSKKIKSPDYTNFNAEKHK